MLCIAISHSVLCHACLRDSLRGHPGSPSAVVDAQGSFAEPLPAAGAAADCLLWLLCAEPLGHLFGAPGSNIQVHSGFYAGWQALEKEVTAAVLSFIKEVSLTNS